MKYDILTDTAFFKAVVGKDDTMVESCYDDFIANIIKVCRTGDAASSYIVLSYTEIEIKACVDYSSTIKLFAGKALAFMENMCNMLEKSATGGMRLHTEEELPRLEWTGQTVDLVELVYALKETGSVNNGEMAIGKMNEIIFRMFGMKSLKDYSRFYVSIKDREADFSHTYFIDKLRRKLNERIKADIKKSLSR